LSLIEVSLVVAVMGIMMMFIPRVMRKTDRRPEFIEQLNVLTRTAWIAALESGFLHRVKFDELKGNDPRVVVQRAMQTGERAAMGSFEDVSVPGVTRVSVPPSVQVVSLAINGVDDASGGDLKNLRFFVAPDGTMQDVQIGLISTVPESQPIRLTLDPLMRRFVYV